MDQLKTVTLQDSDGYITHSLVPSAASSSQSKEDSKNMRRKRLDMAQTCAVLL